MGFGEAVRTCVSKTFEWEGRASRSEFWWFYLALVLTGILAGVVIALVTLATGSTLAGRILYWLVSIAFFFPSLAVTIRRLHDTGRNGAWWWIGFVPLIGGIILLIFMLLPSNPGMNAYGPHPYDHEPYAGNAAMPTSPRPGPQVTPGPHWCANTACQMHGISVATETCTTCGEPTRTAEPA